MRRPSWWKQTLRMRFALALVAGGIVLVFVFVSPGIAAWLDGRAAPLLRPSLALALLAGLLLLGHERLTAIHRRHDRRGD